MSEISQIIYKYFLAVVANIAVAYYMIQNYPEYNMYSLPAIALVLIYTSYNNYKQIYR